MQFLRFIKDHVLSEIVCIEIRKQTSTVAMTQGTFVYNRFTHILSREISPRDC